MYKKLKIFNSKKGFTLIELLVVIGIIAILTLLATPKFLGYSKDAKVATMQADTKVLSNAALIYNIENEEWPIEGDPIELPGDNEGFGYKINKDLIDKNVKSLAHNLDDYILNTETGRVFHAYGLSDKGGQIHYTVDSKKGEKLDNTKQLTWKKYKYTPVGLVTRDTPLKKLDDQRSNTRVLTEDDIEINENGNINVISHSYRTDWTDPNEDYIGMYGLIAGREGSNIESIPVITGYIFNSFYKINLAVSEKEAYYNPTEIKEYVDTVTGKLGDYPKDGLKDGYWYELQS